MTTTTDTTTTDAKARQYLAEFKALPRRRQRRGVNNFVCSRAAGVIDAHGDAVQRPRPAARKTNTPPPAGETQGQAYARLAMEADKRKRGV